MRCPFCHSTDLEEVGFDDVELTPTTAFVVVYAGTRCLGCGRVDESSIEETSRREDHLLFERTTRGEAIGVDSLADPFERRLCVAA